MRRAVGVDGCVRGAGVLGRYRPTGQTCCHVRDGVKVLDWRVALQEAVGKIASIGDSHHLRRGPARVRPDAADGVVSGWTDRDIPTD